MRVWAYTWSEIIARCKAEMKLVREHVEMKAQELSIEGELSDSFPDIFKSDPAS
jgi:hypothetical protein